MPIVEVLLTDTLDQWRQKDNAMITVVNALGSAGSVLGISSPTAGQILVLDGTLFRNVGMTGDVEIAPNGETTIVSGSAASLNKGRLAFAGYAGKLLF